MTIYRKCVPEVMRLSTRIIGFKCTCGAHEPVLFLLNNRQRPSEVKRMIKAHLAESVPVNADDVTFRYIAAEPARLT